MNVPTSMVPAVDELLALDLLTLSEHTQRAGDHIDPVAHAERLRESLAISRTLAVRREGRLVAYAMLNPVSGASWFVRAFNIHPAHRTAPVIRALLLRVAQFAREEGIGELRSNVYKTNPLSMAFHRKLGFTVTKENEKGVEFFATTQTLAGNAVQRSLSGVRPAPITAAFTEP